MIKDAVNDRTFELLIGGKARPGRDFAEVYNPATGAVLARVPMASTADLDEAVEQAHAARKAWGRDEVARHAALDKAADIVVANADLLASMLSLEIGLPYKLAQMEVGGAALFLKHRAADSEQVDMIADDSKQRVYVRRTSIGVTGAILPWNAPLLVASEKLATAFGAGNTVVMKPSPLAPLTVMTFGALIADLFPEGVLSILPGTDELGKALVAHPKVGMISFTGGISAGQSIMAGSAAGLKRLSLELGGNDAAIVLPDVDVKKTARRLFMGAFFRTGQICVAIKRLYVHEAIYDEMVAELKAVAEANVLGDPFDPATTMGPIANRPQYERVKHLVAGALEEGGTAVTGGAPLDTPGNFYPPTLITGLASDAKLVVEEQFGPVLPVLKFSDIDQAIAEANSTIYGLGGSVWTSDTDAGIEIAGQLESGTAWVNQHGIVLPHIPCGGMKLSGIGRANGRVGLDNYSELQTIAVSFPPEKVAS
ncbi:MAG: aldehyde dehydrogenase family protein [Sphingomonadaceae bacterium]